MGGLLAFVCLQQGRRVTRAVRGRNDGCVCGGEGCVEGWTGGVCGGEGCVVNH